MPIGVEQWRAQIGLFYASHMPRALVASKGAKYRRIHWALHLMCLCLALVQLLLQTIDSGQRKLKKTVREWTAQLNKSSEFQHLPTYGNGRTKGLSLLATCLIVVQILLLIAGDVERNPGPLTGQVSRLEVSDLVTVQDELVNLTSKWRDIGLGLGFHPGILDEIQLQKSDPSHCLQEMLERWIKTVNPAPTWEGLAKALERPTVGEYQKAQQLREKYLKSEESEHDDHREYAGECPLPATTTTVTVTTDREICHIASGKKTLEYLTIQKHCPTIIEALAAQVDPAKLAERLHIPGLVTSDVVEQARAVRVYTPIERIRHVVVAVQAHVQLQPATYHDFIHVIHDAYPALAKELMKIYATNLELNASRVLSEVRDWKSLGNNLGINPEKLNELEHSGGDPQYCKEELVKEWVKTDIHASWRKLSQALDQMGEQEVVEKIRGTYTKESGQEYAEQPKDDVEVLREIKDFESRFGDLSFSAQTEMEETNAPIKRFRQHLMLLPESIKSQHLQYLETKLSDITIAESIEKIFMYLNLYWNFFDSDLLEHIIEKFGSDRLKKQIAKYVHDLAEFRRTTTLGQFIKHWPGRAEPPPHFSEVKSHLTKNAMEYTLEELEQIRRKFCIEYRFKPFMWMLARVKQSSIIITWYIPSVLVSKLSDDVLNVHNTFFKFHGIVKLEVDGVCLLNRKKEVQEVKLVEDESENQMQLQRFLQKSMHVRDMKALVEHKEKQLQWERRERGATEQLLKAKMKELELKRKQEQEEHEKLLAALSQRRAQVNSERSQKEQLQRQLHGLHIILKEKEDLAQEVELKRKQEQKERETLIYERDQKQQRVKELEEQLQEVHREKEGLVQKFAEQQELEQLLLEKRQLTKDTHEKEPKQEGQLTGLGEKLEETTEHQPKPKMEQQVSLEKRQLTTHEKEPKQEGQLTGLGEKLEETTEHQPKPKMEQQVSLEKRQLTTHEKGAPLPDWFKKLNDRYAFLDGITVSDVEADALSENLRSNTTVEILQFDNVTFSTNGLSTVLTAFRYNKSVKDLRLQFMTFSDTDSEVLAQVLRINTTIETLELRWVDISDVGFTTLAEAMRDNQSLTTLKIYSVNISDVGFTTLAEAMRDNQSLTTLTLPTKTSDSGANALASAIQENKTLQTLGVWFESVSDGGARDFAKKMEGWGPSLKTLWIWNTRNISGEVKKLLRETARRKGINLSF